MTTRWIECLTKRGESRFCQGEEGRLHVTVEEKPSPRTRTIGTRLVCKHCGTLCAIRIDDEECAPADE